MAGPATTQPPSLRARPNTHSNVVGEIVALSTVNFLLSTFTFHIPLTPPSKEDDVGETDNQERLSELQRVRLRRVPSDSEQDPLLSVPELISGGGRSLLEGHCRFLLRGLPGATLFIHVLSSPFSSVYC